jgi:antitoxin YefM
MYKIHASELDIRFIEALKALFKDKEIEIAVCEAVEHEDDETNYLLSSPANRKHLLQAIENVNNNRNLVTVDMDKLS